MYPKKKVLIRPRLFLAAWGINKKLAMSNKSLILCHPDRLAMERAYLQGQSIAKIARDYGVSDDSLRNHLQNHMSRQLVKAYEKKELDGSMNLLAEIDDIIAHTKEIFKRNFDKGADVTALKALDSQRSTLELLCKISAYLHQTKLLELAENENSFQKEQVADFSDRLKVLTTPELEMLISLQKKIDSQDKRIIIIPERQDAYTTTKKKPTRRSYD